VTSAAEALEITETNNYDLAVLDIKMPKIGGLKLKKILHEKYPDMRFIFLTGHGSEVDFNAGTSEDNVEDYLVKPLKMDIFIQKIKSALEK